MALIDRIHRQLKKMRANNWRRDVSHGERLDALELRANTLEEDFKEIMEKLSQEQPVVLDEGDFSVNNTPEDNRAAFEALSNTSREITLSGGDYEMAAWPRIDNFTGSITIKDGSRIVYQDSSERGTHFRWGSPKLYNYHHAYANPIPDGNPVWPIALTLLETENAVIENAFLDGSPGAGIVFYGGRDMQVLDTHVRNTGRDALHLSGTKNPTVKNYSSYDTGDDGLAFLNYEAGDDRSGGYAAQIYVDNSYKARGITVVGQRDVTIEHFFISKTHGSAVYVVEEQAYPSREPSNVTVRNGYIEFAGTIQKNGSFAGHRDSVFYASVGTGVRFENIKSHAPGRDHIHKGVASSDGLNLDAEVQDVVAV